MHAEHRHYTRAYAASALLVVTVLVAACGQAAGPRQQAATPTSPPASATPAQTCAANLASATRFGDLLVSVQNQFVILSRELPAQTPLKPLQIPNPNDQAALNAQIPEQPLVFPLPASTFPGFVVNICNDSTTASHLVQGGIVQITQFASFASRVNTWTNCDGYFTRSLPFAQTSGGCGGSTMFNEHLLATFPSPAEAGSQVTAVPIEAGPDFGPLPVSLAPGKQIALWFEIAALRAPGTYAFAISAAVDHQQLPFVAAGTPVLFAQVAHKFTGAACLAPQMNAQIPPASTPPTYFICPEGVAVLPTAAPGNG